MTTRFQDVYLPSVIPGFPAVVSPQWSTDLSRAKSGSEQANENFADALRDISLPEGVRTLAQFEALKDHWLVMRGPSRTWPFRDPTDYATVALDALDVEPVTSRTDQQFGTGDGSTLSFQLSKTYSIGSPAEDYTRRIQCPRLSTVQIGINGADPSAISPVMTYTITRPGGIVTFSYPPANGAVLTWGGLFDIIVRFADDETFRGVVRAHQVKGFADIPLTEILACED